MSLYLGNNLVSGVATPIEGARNIGQIIQSTVPLTDAGLHLLDGSLISGSGSYTDFVTYMAGLVSSYSDCFCSEADWQTSVTNYGVCGKFVYDSVNNTVRLPKYSNKIYTSSIASTAPVLGNGMTLGLQNGTQNLGLKVGAASTWSNNIAATNAYGTNKGTTGTATDAAANTTVGVTTDPTKSGIIAQLSNITASIDGYYYIVIATSTKTEIEVDIDEIATDLNGKADTDFTNITNTAKVSIAHNAMPSDRYVDLTLGASDTVYTAPADGWFTISKTAGSDWYTIYLQILDTTGANVLLSQTIVGYRSTELKGSLPAKKGQKCRIWYNASGALQYFRFVYAQGAESEA